MELVEARVEAVAEWQRFPLAGLSSFFLKHHVPFPPVFGGQLFLVRLVFSYFLASFSVSTSSWGTVSFFASFSVSTSFGGSKSR